MACWQHWRGESEPALASLHCAWRVGCPPALTHPWLSLARGLVLQIVDCVLDLQSAARDTTSALLCGLVLDLVRHPEVSAL